MTLRLLRDKGVLRVSPGALGMNLRGRPLDDEDARGIAEALPCARWESTPRAGFPGDGWIVLRLAGLALLLALTACAPWDQSFRRASPGARDGAPHYRGHPGGNDLKVRTTPYDYRAPGGAER